jgi:DNA-binding response OmpR family regulator
MKESKLNILLIEDNEDHAELVKRSFSRYSIANNLIHLSDGEAAIDFFDEHKADFDRNDKVSKYITLLDLRLPKIDGLDVLKHIKYDLGLTGAPVIVLTSSDAQSDIIKAYKLHANSYLVKPMNFDKFSELIKEMVMYWLVWNKSPIL